MSPTAHSTELYTLGKGVLSFNRLDENGDPTSLLDLGNAPNFTLTPTIETIDHFSSREGLKKKDLTRNLSIGLTAKFTLEEYDINNLAMALLATIDGATLNLMMAAGGLIEGLLDFVGDPSAGPKYHVQLWKVSLKPTSEVAFISDDWGKIDFEAEIESDDVAHPDNPYGTIDEIVES
jgi:hypothetical protein